MNALTKLLFIAGMVLLINSCDHVDVLVPGAEPFVCHDEAWSTARTNPKRFIAHAGGQIGGRRYTNSLDAMTAAYRNGYRLIELDLIKTLDDRLVAAHDWEYWGRATKRLGQRPDYDTFIETPLFDEYQAVGLREIDRWFEVHADAYLVTDKVQDFDALLAGFLHRERLLVEVFSIDDFERALHAGIRYPMLSIGPNIGEDVEDAVSELLRRVPVKFAAVAQKRLGKYQKLISAMRDSGSCVYAFTVNDAGAIRSMFEETVYGVYTDSWDLRTGRCSTAPCDNY